MPDAQSAASSPAPSETPTPSLDSLSASDLKHWRQTGEIKASPTPDQTPAAESSPAEPAEQAASTDATSPAASEPAKPKSKTEQRFQELLADRAALREKVESLERRLNERPAPTPDATPAESSPAPARTLDQTITSPDVSRPRMKEAEFFAAHPDAEFGDYADYVANYRIAAADQRRSLESSRAARFGAYKAQIDQAVQADPEFLTSLSPRVANLVPLDLLPAGQAPTALNVIAQEVVTSAVAPQLLAHLSTHPTELDRLAQLDTAAAIARAIGRLEAQLASPLAPPQPVVKTTSSAPPPPATLGSKPTGPADEYADAVKTGDFARFKAAANRRDRASA